MRTVRETCKCNPVSIDYAEVPLGVAPPATMAKAAPPQKKKKKKIGVEKKA